jgi:hypothetical protein
MQCMATKFVVLYPLRDQTAAEVAWVIESRILAFFGGACESFYADNGKNLLKSRYVQKLLLRYSLTWKLGSPYCSRSHGLIEVTNKAVNQIIRILTKQLKLSWVKCCPLLQLALNSRPSAAFNYRTSSYAMFGFKAEHKKQYPKIDSLQDAATLEKFWDEHGGECAKLVEAYAEKVRIRNEAKGGTPQTYEIDTFVFYRDLRPGAYRKIDNRYYSAPFKVVKNYEQVLVVQGWDSRVMSIHKDFVRPATPRQKSLYDTLPMSVKLNVGDSFTFEELVALMDHGQIPNIFLSEKKSHFPLPEQYIGDDDDATNEPNEDELARIEDEADGEEFVEFPERMAEYDFDNVPPTFHPVLQDWRDEEDRKRAVKEAEDEEIRKEENAEAHLPNREIPEEDEFIHVPQMYDPEEGEDEEPPQTHVAEFYPDDVIARNPNSNHEPRNPDKPNRYSLRQKPTKKVQFDI